MASEPFEVTDANGITVRGTVNVGRNPRGAFFDPTSPYYGQPRFADVDFTYFNTREACTIDRATLSRAMQGALKRALENFGIAGPNTTKIEDDTNASIRAMREQCTQNADKYVSNETSSSTDWEAGKSIGGITATAYAALPVPDGGVRPVVARENTWPADAVPASDDDSSLIPTLRPDAGGDPTPADTKPIRYLSSRIVGRSAPSGFGVGSTAPPLVPSDENFDPRQTPFGDRFGGSSASTPAGRSRGARQPETLQQAAPLLGLVSGKPMSFYPVPQPICNSPERSAPNEDADDWLTHVLQGIRSR